jgi:hypothetical protein
MRAYGPEELRQNLANRDQPVRHASVEQQEVGIQPTGEGDGTCAASSRTDHLEVGAAATSFVSQSRISRTSAATSIRILKGTSRRFMRACSGDGGSTIPASDGHESPRARPVH